MNCSGDIHYTYTTGGDLVQGSARPGHTQPWMTICACCSQRNQPDDLAAMDLDSTVTWLLEYGQATQAPEYCAAIQLDRLRQRVAAHYCRNPNLLAMSEEALEKWATSHPAAQLKRNEVAAIVKKRGYFTTLGGRHVKPPVVPASFDLLLNISRSDVIKLVAVELARQIMQDESGRLLAIEDGDRPTILFEVTSIDMVCLAQLDKASALRDHVGLVKVLSKDMMAYRGDVGVLEAMKP